MASFSVGALLRQERLRQDLSLSDIANRTRISQRYLDAIEKENFDSLPGLVFARNFVRQYASALKVDPEPMLAGLPKVDLANAPMPDPQAPVRRSTWDPRWTSRAASVMWFGSAIIAAAAAYIHFNHPARIGASPAVRASVREAGSSAGPKRNPVTATPPVAEPEAAASAFGGNPSEPAQSALNASAAAGSVPPAGAEEKKLVRPIQVLLTAHEPSWVEVTADGKTAFSGTLEANDSRSIGADALVKLVTGNAGGIAISLNGRTLESLGPPGQVRTVRLTAEGLQSAPESPPPAPDPL